MGMEEVIMSEATVIGLGSMGAALVRALLAAGRGTTVWNRSPARMQPLIASGARGAGSLAEAVAGSPTIITCIDKHATTRSLLGEAGVRESLAGRTVVELSTGLPGHARESKAWFEQQGAAYLDGKMLTGPHDIGQPNGQFIYAGPLADYQRLEPTLKSLAGRTHHVGTEIGAAAALDLAWLSAIFGLYLGVAHGAQICEAEGVRGEFLATVFPTMPSAQWLADTIARREFDDPGAPLVMWRAALSLIQREAADAGIAAEVPDFAGVILDRAIAAGHGGRHIAAIVDVLGGKEPKA